MQISSSFHFSFRSKIRIENFAHIYDDNSCINRMAPLILATGKHKAFFQRILKAVPASCEQLDTSRLTLLFFVLSGLDILGGIEDLGPELRREIIEWIYALQIRIDQGAPKRCCGFRGNFASAARISNEKSIGNFSYDTGHLAMTYTGLACLLILNDDLSRVDRYGVLQGVKACQLEDGSFCAHPGGSENDMRFVYCAVAICYMLRDFSAIDQKKLMEFVQKSWNYDGGFAQCPGLESHGGSTFCATASLHMLNRLDEIKQGRKYEKLLRWCVWKQSDGFHGRPSKPDDSCYTFWLGATLKLLDSSDLVDAAKIVNFTLSTQDAIIGGFGKYPDVMPDALHAYMSLSGLAIFGQEHLRPVNSALNITERAYRHWISLA